jgi:hypothetical protein
MRLEQLGEGIVVRSSETVVAHWLDEPGLRLLHLEVRTLCLKVWSLHTEWRMLPMHRWANHT